MTVTKYLFVYFLVSLIFIVIFEIYALYKSIIEIRKRERSMNNIGVYLQSAYKEGYELGLKAKQRTVWIPVSERLPEEDVKVLTTIKWKDGSRYVGIDSIVGGKWMLNIPEDGDTTIAWMPLPEPYKAESEDRE